MKKAVFILPPKNFNDEQYFSLKEFLERKKYEVIPSSTSSGLILGKEGGEVFIRQEIENLNIEQYSVVILIGGEDLNELASRPLFAFLAAAYKKQLLIIALSNAPVLLASSGIAQGRRITIWRDTLRKKFVRQLEDSDVEYVDKQLVHDKNLITVKNNEALPLLREELLAYLDN